MEFDLVVPSRRYIYEGFLLEKEERKMRDRYVFLFNDLLLVSAHQVMRVMDGLVMKFSNAKLTFLSDNTNNRNKNNCVAQKQKKLTLIKRFSTTNIQLISRIWR